MKMNSRLTLDMIALSELNKSTSSDALALADLGARVTRYLRNFSWCTSVRDVFYDQGIPQAAVFLVRIDPAQPTVDEEYWIVAGDIPPIYLDCPEIPDGQAAFDCYCLLVREWIEAVKKGGPLDELMPMTTADGLANLSATPEVVAMLETRVRFIEDKLLGTYVRLSV